MSHAARCMGMVLAVGLALLGSAYGAAESVPLVDGFESCSLGSQNTPFGTNFHWSHTGGVNSVIITNIVTEGSKSCYITNNTLALDINDGLNYSNVWIQIYAKPAFVESDSAGVEAMSAAFFVKTDGTLRAYCGSVWTNCGTVPTDGRWLGFAVHMDYANGKWDLYVDDSNTYAGRFRRAFYTNLDMAPLGTRSNQLSQIVVDVGASAYVDAVAASPAYVFCSGYPSNVLTRLSPPSGTTTTNIEINPRTHDSAEDRLDQRLGDDLASGYEIGTELRIWSTNATWNRYQLFAGSPPYWQMVGGGILQTVMRAPSSQAGMLVTSNQPSQIGFLGYNEVVDAAPITVPGTNDSGTGFGHLAWPFVTSRTPHNSTLGFSNIVQGCQIYRYLNGRWLRWYWNNSQFTGPTNQLGLGDDWWFKNRGTGNFTWNPTQN